MKILFLTMGRVDNIENSGLYTDLLRKFRDENHELYVMSPIERKQNKATNLVKKDGIYFLKVKIGNIKNVNLIEKGLSTLSIEPLFLKAIKKYYNNIKFDLVLYTTPPITFTKVIEFIKKRDGAFTYLLLKDIFPQNAVDMEMFNTINPIYKMFRKKELQLYNISDVIGCMSSANVNYIKDKNPNLSNTILEVNPNTVKPVEINIDDYRTRKIRKKYKLPINKNIFIYGGNLGKPQGIDFLIECIKENENNNSSYFLVVGSGTEFNKLKKYFINEQPLNSKLLERLPKEDYDLLVNTCDVGLIFLDKRFTIPNFPSRLLSYMRASMPVIAATDPNTDIGKIIEEGNFGYSCISNDSKKFNDLVVKLSNKDLQYKMGKNARKYLENNYTSEHSYKIIMKHFK